MVGMDLQDRELHPTDETRLLTLWYEVKLDVLKALHRCTKAGDSEGAMNFARAFEALSNS